jgi:hypothetical protein
MDRIRLVRRTQVRQVITVVAVPLLAILPACKSTVGVDSVQTAGVLHDNGVRYVLEHLDTIPPQAQLPVRVANLVREYCQTIGRKCSASVANPSFPLDAERIAVSQGSDDFKRITRTLFLAGRSAPNLRAFTTSVDAVEREARTRLNSTEREHFASIASIARSSATYWAPKSQGGRDGAGTRLPYAGNTGSTVKVTIDWVEVAEADWEGCVQTIEFGCVDGAILFSVADILKQLLENALTFDPPLTPKVPASCEAVRDRKNAVSC